MFQQFQQFIINHRLADNKFLLAVSGGVDSMVLTNLFKRANLSFIVAHCNYHLRGDDSDSDEQCVAIFCKNHKIPFYVKQFNMPEILKHNKTNLQLKARELRYNWFEEMKQEQDCDYIVTAHHSDDVIETMLINFFKGTGIAGLHGIAMFRDNIFRPLLDVSKDEIYQYAKENDIVWREDVSNSKNDYLRNQVRNRLIPLAEEIFPNAVINLKQNVQRMSEAEMLYRKAIEQYRDKLIERRGNDYYLSVLKLKQCQPLKTILYEMLLPYGFISNQTKDAIQLLNAESGKYIQSKAYRLIRNRNMLIITSLQNTEADIILIDKENLEVGKKVPIICRDFELEFHVDTIYKRVNLQSINNNEAWIDLKQLQFPLILRPWKTGDYFYPLGMNNKKKKVSRYLSDIKIPLHEKEKIWVLESNKKIVWLIGLRIDERFKIVDSTSNILKIKCNL